MMFSLALPVLVHLPVLKFGTKHPLQAEPLLGVLVMTMVGVPTLRRSSSPDSFAMEQRRDRAVKEILDFVEKEVLPVEDSRAWKVHYSQ